MTLLLPRLRLVIKAGGGVIDRTQAVSDGGIQKREEQSATLEDRCGRWREGEQSPVGQPDDL